MSVQAQTHRRFLLSCLSFLGVASLCYVLGAAVIFFDLPSASFLRRAFVGGVSWYEHGQASPALEEQLTVNIGPLDKLDKTCDGFTLCLCKGGPRALLIDMHGNTVHSWEPPFKTILPEPVRQLPTGLVEEWEVYFNDARIFPNGDLLALVSGRIHVRSPSDSYGLVKLDKEARVLWAYSVHCHHALDVGEDGTIYTLSYNFQVRDLPRGLEEYIPTPCMTDSVEVISPQGKQIKRIPLVEAFANSPYALLLGALKKPQLFSDLVPADSPTAAAQEEERRRDVLHTNAVQVLSRKLAPKFPLFKAGDLLISSRHLDAIAMLDPDSEKVVWAARGLWHAQHDPSFLDNGHLLLFDNLGSPKGSRVLEYDPQNQSFPWWYPDDNGPSFFTRIRGLTQRLPNGNTLIVNSNNAEANAEVFEVTPEREKVWSCSFGGVPLTCARRYMPEQLPFLHKEKYAR
jgi:hypothetical protein